MFITNSKIDQIKNQAAQLARKRGGGECVFYAESMKFCVRCGKGGTSLELIELPPHDRRFSAGARKVVACAVGLCEDCRSKPEESLIVDLAATIRLKKGWVDSLGHAFSWK